MAQIIKLACFVYMVAIMVINSKARRMPHQVEDDDDSAELSYRDMGNVLLDADKYQQRRRTHALRNNDQLADKLIESMDFRDILNMYQILKGNKRSFTAAQTTFQGQVLQRHNYYRKCHNVPLFTLDDGLSTSAQNYANQMASTGVFQHSGSDNGENLYMMQSSSPICPISGNIPTDSWYNETYTYKYKYNQEPYDSNGNPLTSNSNSAAGHFTQSVWKSTATIGAGYACTSDQKTIYVVAQFSPPGNYLGQFIANVLAPTC